LKRYYKPFLENLSLYNDETPLKDLYKLKRSYPQISPNSEKSTKLNYCPLKLKLLTI